uniref:Collagen triple helix repeat protein n=1 Tax=Heterorhabditis bacteriophora TaxID=37862 RepID=A0A1I7XEF8_HETBA
MHFLLLTSKILQDIANSAWHDMKPSDLLREKRRVSVRRREAASSCQCGPQPNSYGTPGPAGPAGNPGQPGGDGQPGPPGGDGQPGNDAQYCPCPPRSGVPESTIPSEEKPYGPSASGNQGQGKGGYRHKRRRVAAKRSPHRRRVSKKLVKA